MAALSIFSLLLTFALTAFDHFKGATTEKENTLTWKMQFGSKPESSGFAPRIQVYGTSDIQIGGYQATKWIAETAEGSGQIEVFQNWESHYIQFNGWSDDVCITQIKILTNHGEQSYFFGDMAYWCGQGTDLTSSIQVAEDGKAYNLRCVWLGRDHNHSTLGRFKLRLKYFYKKSFNSTLRNDDYCYPSIGDYYQYPMTWKRSVQMDWLNMMRNNSNFVEEICKNKIAVIHDYYDMETGTLCKTQEHELIKDLKIVENSIGNMALYDNRKTLIGEYSSLKEII